MPSCHHANILTKHWLPVRLNAAARIFTQQFESWLSYCIVICAVLFLVFYFFCFGLLPHELWCLCHFCSILLDSLTPALFLLLISTCSICLMLFAFCLMIIALAYVAHVYVFESIACKSDFAGGLLNFVGVWKQYLPNMSYLQQYMPTSWPGRSDKIGTLNAGEPKYCCSRQKYRKRLRILASPVPVASWRPSVF